MKPRLFLILCILICVVNIGKAQSFFYDAGPLDSFVIRFNTDTSHYYFADTSTAPLWQIGKTYKSFFSTDTNKVALMTDTVSNYPINADNWFVLRIPNISHTLISFWHKFQTDSGHDGGLVEYSVDNGASWHNVKDSCNIDGASFIYGILTAGFYAKNDTLQSGQPAFSGSSGDYIYSAFEFAGGPGLKTTSTYCNFYPVDTFYVRFRFVSDSTPDTLAGWFIDSVKVNYYMQSGGIVNNVMGTKSLKVFPNPSHTGTFTFPPLKNE